jgi:hypothetical protein
MWVDNNGDKRQTEAKQPHFILSKVVYKQELEAKSDSKSCISLFGWMVADGWCWFVLREEYCWLVAGG